VKQENAVLGHLTAPLPTVESPRARLGSVPATATERQPSWSAVGSVVFVGGGPTGPDLLTVRGAQALARARVLFVDDPADAALFAPGASAVVPARRPRRGGAGDDSLVASRPEAVADAVVRALRPEVGVGCREVVRLVRGDVLTTPGVAAEIAACRRRGIVVDVVPGVPEATAWPAFAGADLAGATGLEAVIVDVRTPSGVPTDGLRPVRSGTGPLSDAEAGSLAAARTAVVLGSQAVMAPVIAQLAALDGGRSAIITVDPGLQTQRSTRGTLSELSVLGEMVEAAAGPRAAGETAAVPGSGGSRTAVLVVGAGAEADMLPADPDPWFEGRPLFGWKVLVPRTKEQAGTLSEALRSYGALPVEVPTIAVEAPRAPQQVEKAVRGLVEGRFEWLVFTSVNALRAIRDKIVEYGLDARALSGLKIATVGEKTAAALRDWGIEPDLVPTGEQSGAGLLAEFPPYDRVLDPIDRVLLPRADIATELLVSGLVELGWQVEDVTAYRTVRAAPPPAEVREAIKTGAFDAVVFTSSSTVRNLVGIAGKPHPTTVVACIGPQTVDDLAAALAAFALERRTALVAAGEPVRTPAQSRPARGAARRAGS
jgi:uroporphyrinogen III methyltransferase/synthase